MEDIEAILRGIRAKNKQIVHMQLTEVGEPVWGELQESERDSSHFQ